MECQSGHLQQCLHQEMRPRNTANIQSLVEMGVDPNLVAMNERSSPLYVAVQTNHPDSVQLFIQAGADINSIANSLGSSLHIAAQSRYLERVRILIAKGTEVNHTGDGAFYDSDSLGAGC